MQNHKVNTLKKVFGIIALLTLLLTSSLLSAAPIRIMPLGDSITEGYDNIYYPTTDESIAYRGPLWTKLSTGKYNVDFVGSQLSGSNYSSNDPTFDLDHEGHSGFRADQISSNVNSYLTANPADVVLLHIGTNDLSQSQSIESTVADVNTTLENIDSVSKDIKVIIARIINREINDPDTTTFNNQLNTMVQQRISNGDDITIVDMENDAGIDYTTDMISELHPNVTGYAKMADLWYSALKTVIPTHLWKLEEATGSTTYLDTYRETNGTCIGVACPVMSIGQIGNAQLFEGNDEVTVADDNTFDWNGSDSFTIEFWVKPTRTDGANQVIVGRENEAKDNFFWWAGIVGSDGHITFRLRDDSGNEAVPLDGPVLNIDEWYHVACVRDAANNQNIMYVNGVNVVSSPATYTGNFVGTTPVNVGYLTFNGSNRFHLDSTVDELTVYNGALNAAQANLHYVNGQPKVLSITSVPVTFAELNTPYFYDVNSSNDPNAVFVLNTSPAWMNIDPDFGIIDGTPDTAGNFAVEVQADTSTETAIQNYVLKVRNTAILPSGMSHYWKFDENDTINDTRTYIDSYSGADGNCTGGDAGCPQPRDGRINGAQSFDGSDMVDVIDTTGFNWAANDSFTIEYWIRIDDGTDLSNNMVVIGRDGDSYTWWSGIQAKTGNAIFSLRNNTTNNTNTQIISTNPIVGNTGIHAGGHHIAVVRDGDANETRLYIDGVKEPVISKTYTGDFMDASASPVNIGYLNFNGSPDFFLNNGTSGVDDMAVFNTAMSDAQILEHYNNSLAGNSFEVLVDTTAPVITLLGSNPQMIIVGSAYTELNATAQDDVDGDISANIVIDASAVDTTTLGQYTVTYDVNDSAGNTAQVTRTVNVVDTTVPVVDTTAPVITLLGSNPQMIIVGSAYTELNATAQDDVDGDISANIVIDASAVDTTTLGQYTVTYDVNDSAGNAAVQVTRTVNVVDTTVPVTAPTVNSSGGGCTYNPDSKNFDMSFLLMIALGLFYPFRRRFIK